MNGDRTVPNLPVRDLALAEEFYSGFGFTRTYLDDGWMILDRGPLRLEFFEWHEHDPQTTASRCTVRVADADELVDAIRASGVPVAPRGIPRLEPVMMQPWGLRAGALVDPDGNLLVLIEEPGAPVVARWARRLRG